MSVVGPIAAKKLQGRECSEVFSLQQNILVIRSSRPHNGHHHSRTVFMECASGRTGSLRLEAGELDPLAPFLGFVCYELSEVGGRARQQRAAQISKPRLDLGIGKPSVDLLVELVDDLDGC